MDSSVDQMLAAFGGLHAFCDATGIPATTVRYWRKTGEVKSRHAVILSAARQRGIDLTAEQLLGDV